MFAAGCFGDERFLFVHRARAARPKSGGLRITYCSRLFFAFGAICRTSLAPMLNPLRLLLSLGARGLASPQGRVYYVDHRSQISSWSDPRLPQEQQQQEADVRGEFNHRSAASSRDAPAAATTAAAAAAAATASSSSKSFKPTGAWVSSAGASGTR